MEATRSCGPRTAIVASLRFLPTPGSTLPPHAGAQTQQDTVRIHSGKDKPEQTYAAVRYRDYWFWIEHGDLKTKRALAAIMLFFTLVDTGSKEPLPLITIPAH